MNHPPESIHCSIYYNFPQVAWHLLALLAVIAWTGITSILVLLPLLLCGKLRIIDADEKTGMDVKKIKEQSYHGSHCCDCKPTIIVPSSEKNSTIYRSAIAPITESSFGGAVSFPLPSPSSAAQPQSKYSATEHVSNPPSLLSTIPLENSLPVDMEEVTLETSTLYMSSIKPITGACYSAGVYILHKN